MARVDIDEADVVRRIEDALFPGLGRATRETARLARSNTPDHPDTPGPIARDSIESEVDRATMTGRVGSPLLRFRFLELGTVKMAPRAPLRRAIDELGPRYPEMVRRG